MIPRLLLLEKALKAIVIASVKNPYVCGAIQLRGRSVEIFLITGGNGYVGPCFQSRHCCCKANPGSPADHKNALVTEGMHRHSGPFYTTRSLHEAGALNQYLALAPTVVCR